MGAGISSVFQRLFGAPQLQNRKILILGLDAAGKTVLLNRIKLPTANQPVVTSGQTTSSTPAVPAPPTVPTIGFNMETVSMPNGLSFTCFDIGGQDMIIPLWRHYFNQADALVFVVDSSDTSDRLEKASHLLSTYLFDKESALVATCTTVLVFANKQDMPGARPGQEVAKGLKLNDLFENVSWHVEECAVVNQGDRGVERGFSWLAEELGKKVGGQSAQQRR